MDGIKPSSGRHVFASVQTLNAKDSYKDIDPGFYETVIIDEFHHAEASTYKSLLDHFKPIELLGMTATPERGDGKDVRDFFDGETAHELRLWDAIDRHLLSPFQYFAVHDAVDLSSLSWSAGRYQVSELENLYTANDFRVGKIIAAMHEILENAGSMRALGFCVSKRHAEFMASKFNKAGIEARYLTSDTSSQDRKAAKADLSRGEIQILFVVDLFNEGVDIPDVDTILFLRPTESSTIFLQQLGRGLRKTDDKSCLTVLDFVGNSHKKFRVDQKFAAMSGIKSRTRLASAIENDFPVLPTGCAIQLDKVSREIVLANIKSAISRSMTKLKELLLAMEEPRTLAGILEESGLKLRELYKGGWYFTKLLRYAELLPSEEEGGLEKDIGRRLVLLLHIDDQNRLDGMRRIAAGDFDGRALLDLQNSDVDNRVIRGLLYTLSGSEHPAKWQPYIDELHSNEALSSELHQLSEVIRRDNKVPPRHRIYDELIPLQLHAHYSIREIVALLFDFQEKDKFPTIREGHYHFKSINTRATFVTLNKSEKEYSPSTMYEDYAISDVLFHWESQSNTTEQSRTGQQHIHHVELGVRYLLFVRDSKKDDYGATKPYLFAGDIAYQSHVGSRPMKVVWKLSYPLPERYLKEVKVVA